jgi:hypothetical protein
MCLRLRPLGLELGRLEQCADRLLRPRHLLGRLGVQPICLGLRLGPDALDLRSRLVAGGRGLGECCLDLAFRVLPHSCGPLRRGRLDLLSGLLGGGPRRGRSGRDLRVPPAYLCFCGSGLLGGGGLRAAEDLVGLVPRLGEQLAGARLQLRGLGPDGRADPLGVLSRLLQQVVTLVAGRLREQRRLVCGVGEQLPGLLAGGVDAGVGLRARPLVEPGRPLARLVLVLLGLLAAGRRLGVQPGRLVVEPLRVSAQPFDLGPGLRRQLLRLGAQLVGFALGDVQDPGSLAADGGHVCGGRAPVLTRRAVDGHGLIVARIGTTCLASAATPLPPDTAERSVPLSPGRGRPDRSPRRTRCADRSPSPP